MSQPSQIPDEQLLSLPDFSAITPAEQGSTLPPSRPWWRRGGIIIIILVLLLILASILSFLLIRGRTRNTTYHFQKVTQGDFSLSVSATGPLQSSVYNLVFTGTGKIAEIDVSVGQTVMENQVLAKLDKTSLQDAIDQAQAGVLNAQTSLSNAQANLNKTQAQSQASIQAGQTALNNAQASLTTTLSQSQANINAAQTTLSNDQINLSFTLSQSQASINFAQTTLSNDQINLSKTQATANAQIKLAKAQEQQAIANCNSMPTPTPNCVQLAIDQYNQAVAQANANVATAQARVDSDQKQLSLTEAQANTNNATAQARVNSDQQQLSTAEAQANSNNTTAQNQVSTATSQLASSRASANVNVTNEQGLVNTAQGQLQTALVQLQTAKHNFDNSILRAPHNGIVTTINGTVGGTPGVPANATTTTAANASTFIQIADISSLQVQANVNESDTANLTIGEPAQFTVSAYGNRIFSGTIGAISPFGQTVSNVVTYPVTIDVDMNSLNGANLLPNMTASVTIIVVQRHNMLLIPVNAVNFARTATRTINNIPALITDDQAKSALAQARQMLIVLQNENPSISQDNPIPAYVLERPVGQTAFIPVPIVLGLTDDTFYEVLKGLSPGEIIVVGAQSG
ncbi:MAG TPA: efflux RND transporter periplasmic adaptor subunit [Ktedonobacteraceae bacterium]|nr:efflux RND transporter periplasmic adaptor subunit [Ktedonobacteraceae bacterium]